MVSLDPVTHHCIFNMYLAVAGDNQKFKIQEQFESQVAMTNPNGVCNLVKSPDTNTQFQPENTLTGLLRCIDDVTAASWISLQLS